MYLQPMLLALLAGQVGKAMKNIDNPDHNLSSSIED